MRTEQDFELISVRGEYINNGNNAPFVREPFSFYKQKESSTYSYRGVKVFVKETLNTDLSHRGYVVEGISIESFSKELQYSEVRGYIDGLYDILDEKLNDRPLICEYKMSKDGDLYDTCIDSIISRKYNVLEKRYILSDLIKKGLTKSDALQFLTYIF